MKEAMMTIVEVHWDMNKMLTCELIFQAIVPAILTHSYNKYKM